jgi:hypothetical protein
MNEHLILGIINCSISFIYFLWSIYIGIQWIYALPLFFGGIGFISLYTAAKIKELRKKERICYIWTDTLSINFSAVTCKLCSIESTRCCEPGTNQIRTFYEKRKIIEYYFIELDEIPANEFIKQSNKGIYL